VVVKVLLEEGLKNDWVVKKFQQEIESLTRLDDPGVVGIFDAGTLDDGTPYLVMQYVDGSNLRALIKPEGMDLQQVANIINQIGRSISAAHDACILHRDLKPENIMLRKTATGEHVKIIDFGIAKVRNSVSGQSTATGMTAGTIGYMSPEQLSAKPLTAASDIYSLAVIAYEMITGRKPFNPDSAYQLLEMQRAGVRVKPADLRPSLPEEAQEIILKALSFDPRDRFQRAQEFGERLARALNAEYDASELTTRDMLEEKAREASKNRPLAQTVPAQAKVELSLAPPKIDQAKLETAHVLFMDIVGYSKLLIDEQTARLQELQDTVRNTQEFQRAQAADQLLRLPTGDGMALSFFGDPESPVRCAVEISRALRTHPDLRLRMGVNRGLVYRINDITENLNIAGGGINFAQRVMDCGDAGHILLSKRVADDLGQLSRWAKDLHDLGEIVFKHGERVYIYSLYNDEIGNAEVPAKLRKPKPRLPALKRRPVAAASVVVIAVLLVAVAVFSFIKLRSRFAQSAAATPGTVVSGPNAAAERTFSYSMIVQKYRNGRPYQKPFTIPGELNFEADDRIQLLFTSPEQGYLYLVNKGPDNKTNSMILYPDDAQAALLPANQPVQIPAPSKNADEDWIGFDKEVGTEQLWVIWSAKPVPTLEAVKKWSNPKDLGEIKDAEQEKRVREFLASYEGSLPEGKRNQEGTRTTVSGNGEIVVYRINLQHH
jgi:class 3 adenylate cyclase